jgi:hypothetical protein
MRDNTLNTIRHIGVAIKFFGFGIIVGLYLSYSQFRYPYILVAVLIFTGVIAQRFGGQNKRQ